MKQAFVAALALALAACGSERPKPAVRIVYSIDLEKAVDDLRASRPGDIDPALAAEARRQALARAVDTIRRRVAGLGVDGARVVSEGEQIVVELPAIDEERSAATRAAIARTGALTMKVVDSDAPVMRAIYRTVGGDEPTDPEARALDVRARAEAWQAPDGARLTDYYLDAVDREEPLPIEEARRTGCIARGAVVDDGQVRCLVTGRRLIERYVASLRERDPALQLPDDRELAFERVELAGQRPSWRSYLLVRAVRLDGGDLAKVERTRDHAGRAELQVTFDADGRRKLAELTREAVGKKLAILIDGLVQSAPVIASPITGGKVTITMGGVDPAEQARDAAELASVLRAGSLPAPLREESISR